MTMPNFLGVGFFRCGTSWLHDLLDSHPQCYVPQAFKEIHYFTPQHIGRGRPWYESFFPEDPTPYRAIGEIGPGYCRGNCIDRIAAEPGLGESGRFLFMIRNPVDRYFSGYRQQARTEPRPLPIEEARDIGALTPEQLAFAPAIRRWRDRFGPDRVLVTLLEHVQSDPVSARERVAAFLGLDPKLFPPEAGATAANRSVPPKHRRAYKLAAGANVWLVRHGLHHVSGALRRMGLRRLFGFGAGKDTVPPMRPETRRRLGELIEPDVRELEAMLGLDLNVWRRRNGLIPEEASSPAIAT